MFYAKSTGGFYDPAINDAMPADAVEIDQEEYAALMAGQVEGKVIASADDGKPFLQDPPALTGNALIKGQIDALESTVTQRRLREAVLGTDGGWLAGVNAQIAALRASLT